MISTAQHVVVRNADVKYILLTGGIFMYHEKRSNPCMSAPMSIFELFLFCTYIFCVSLMICIEIMSIVKEGNVVPSVAFVWDFSLDCQERLVESRFGC